MKIFRLIIFYSLVVISLLLGIGAFYYVYKGYFVIGVDEFGYYDGWGRTLYEPPSWVKMVYPDMQWPGTGWFVFDLVVFWLSLSVCAGLLKLGEFIYPSTKEAP